MRCSVARSIAALHLNEGVARLSNLSRAVRAEVDVAALAEVLGRARKTQDRPDLVSQKNDRDRQQDDHRAQHPQNENVGVRFIGERAARDQPKYPVA